MQVKVKLFATLAQHYPGARPGVPFEVSLPDGSTLDELVKHMALPEAEVKINFINGHTESPDTILLDGDEIGIFPPIGGG